MNFKNKTFTILGLARSGMASAELILKKGGKVKISEAASEEKLKGLVKDWPCLKDLHIEYGGHTQDFIEKSDYLVLSPGVRIDALSVQWAKKRNIPVLGEIELAWKICERPVIAVTGSNGKTTVSTLIAKVLETGGKKVCLCGNIGSPFSKYVLDQANVDCFVLEVSSFQMESIVDFRPYVAVFTNFSQNHLDRHKDLQEYFDAKKRIFLNQQSSDYAVLNYEDPMIRALAGKLNSIISFFNPPGIYERAGTTNPNFLAALEVGRIFDVPFEVCQKVFSEFKGVEHRLEWVRNLNGVDYINDSKATTAQAGRWALECMSNPIHLICGGRDKNIDFTVLKNLVGQKVKRLYVIGEAREKLTQAFKGAVAIEDCSDLKDAVERARHHANKGDCVLLTPMCASFDMFKDFEDRGRVFKNIVQQLK